MSDQNQHHHGADARRPQAVRHASGHAASSFFRLPAIRFQGRWSSEQWMLASLFATLGVLVAAIVPGFSQALRPAEHAPTTTLALALPPLPKRERAPAPVDPWQTVTIQSGQTMGQVFERLGLPAADLQRLLAYPGAKGPLTQLRAGAEFAFDIPAPGQLRAVRFDKDESKRVVFSLEGDSVREQTHERAVERRVRVATGEINSSLFAAGAAAGLSNATLVDLANAFSYDIDFTQDLRKGDRFQVIYEEIWRDGERLRDGGIVGASFINQGKRYTALRFERAGKQEYFSADGRPLKKSFMRMPIEFARISSHFSSARKHPVLGRTRAHKGVDYAARSGTPIMAAGDARVAFAGWQNGFGRVVILDHGRGYSTLYGHMSRFGKYRSGQHVKQGNVIGYVGATGLATGPHLHYEFRVNGVHRNPLTVTMPPPAPLSGADMARFRQATAPALAQLQLVEGVRLATAGAAGAP